MRAQRRRLKPWFDAGAWTSRTPLLLTYVSRASRVTWRLGDLRLLIDGTRDLRSPSGCAVATSSRHALSMPATRAGAHAQRPRIAPRCSHASLSVGPTHR